jgi:hypothetical protein
MVAPESVACGKIAAVADSDLVANLNGGRNLYDWTISVGTLETVTSELTGLTSQMV